MRAKHPGLGRLTLSWAVPPEENVLLKGGLPLLVALSGACVVGGIEWSSYRRGHVPFPAAAFRRRGGSNNMRRGGGGGLGGHRGGGCVRLRRTAAHLHAESEGKRKREAAAAEAILPTPPRGVVREASERLQRRRTTR